MLSNCTFYLWDFILMQLYLLNFAVDQKASILYTIIQNISESFDFLMKCCNAEENGDRENFEGTVSKVVVFLELLLSITQVIMNVARTTSDIVSSESSTRHLILDHCVRCFRSALIASQIEV